MAGFRNRETVFDPQEVMGSDFSDGFMDGDPWHMPSLKLLPVTFLYESTSEHPHVVFYLVVRPIAGGVGARHSGTNVDREPKCRSRAMSIESRL